jgi:hypothetical protein
MKIVYEKSDDNLYRFALGEVDEKDKNPLIFFGINPSTATPGNPDPTIRKIKAISKANNHDSWIMLDVCPQRVTKPKDLYGTCNPIMHEKNIEVIKGIVKAGYTLVATWGDYIKKGTI